MTNFYVKNDFHFEIFLAKVDIILGNNIKTLHNQAELIRKNIQILKICWYSVCYYVEFGTITLNQHIL